MVVKYLKDSMQSEVFIPVVLAGLITALLDIIISISFAAIVFSGDLTMFLPRGIGIAFFTTTVVCLFLALTSRFKGLISVTQDAGIVVLAVVAGHIVGKFDDPTSDSVFVTVAAFIALSSLCTGVFFVLLGRFRLGNLIRYIPYPVIGGFLAAVGLILFQSAFSLVADITPSTSNLDVLFQGDKLVRWMPALIFGVAMFVVTRVRSHYLIMPSILIIGVVLFFVGILFSGESVNAAQNDGWMLGPFPEDSAWKPFILEDLSLIEWDFILDEVWHIPSIALVSAIALLLNISGLEVQSDDEVEVTRELELSGLANIGLAMGGGFVGFHTLSLTMLGWRMDGKGRLLGVVFSLTFIVVLIFGFSLIAFFPKYVLAGLLIFLGIDILVEWMVQGWFKMAHQEYAVMVFILLTVATVGYLEGVGLGILAAAVLFTFNYSRIDTVKQALSGKTYHSKVDRPYSHYRQLHEIGESLTIYRLNGAIFFGSASQLLDQSIMRLEDNALQPVRYLILDFRHVQAVDSSAILTFIRLNQLLHRQGVVLIFSDLSHNLHDTFRRSGFDLTKRSDFRLFSGLDEAVEWCESMLLRESSATRVVPGSFEQQLSMLFPDFTYYNEIYPYLTRLSADTGDTIAVQGEESASLFWVESGRLEARVEAEGGHVRVRTATTGAIMGEIGLYSTRPRSASIIASEPGIIYELSQEAMARMEVDNPVAAAAFHKLITVILAERLADTTDSLLHYLE